MNSEYARTQFSSGRPHFAEELVSFAAPGSPEAERYRVLREGVERLHREAGTQVIAITSPGAGDGKTVTTLNLAGALAQSATSRLLLVDADLHRASMAGYLGLDRAGRPGLAETILNEHVGLADSVHRIDSMNLSVLFAGAPHPRPYDLLASARFETLVAAMRRDYDYVLIDTPPVVPLADSPLLGRWVDGFIVVVAAHKTPKKMLAEANRLLDAAKIIGMVFNGDDRTRHSYYGYYGPHTPAPSDAAPPARWRRMLNL